jgi:hypothetical protein
LSPKTVQMHRQRAQLLLRLTTLDDIVRWAGEQALEPELSGRLDRLIREAQLRRIEARLQVARAHGLCARITKQNAGMHRQNAANQVARAVDLCARIAERDAPPNHRRTRVGL